MEIETSEISNCPDCGYAEGSFACKIRHLQINTGAAKAGAVTPAGKQVVEVTPNGRVIR